MSTFGISVLDFPMTPHRLLTYILDPQDFSHEVRQKLIRARLKRDTYLVDMAYESVCPPTRSPTAQFNCQAIAHALYHCLLFALPVVRRTCEIAKHIGHINILYIHKVSLDLSNMINSDLSRHNPVTKAAQLQVMIKHGGKRICDPTPASLGRYE